MLANPKINLAGVNNSGSLGDRVCRVFRVRGIVRGKVKGIKMNFSDIILQSPAMVMLMKSVKNIQQ